MRLHMVSMHAGGRNGHVTALATAMARQGIEVVVHTRRDDPSLPRRSAFAPGVIVERVDAGPARPVSDDDVLAHIDALVAELRRAWLDDRPDALFSHGWLAGWAALYAAQGLDIPVVHAYDGLAVVARRRFGEKAAGPRSRVPIESRLAGAVDRIIAATDAERRELTRIGANPARVTVIPRGIDLARFSPFGPAKARPDDAKRVLVLTRRLHDGIADVLDAVATRDDVRLIVAGGPRRGLLSDDADARRLKAAAISAGVARRVDWLGAVEFDRVPALLRSVDVVACCPRSETTATVAIEAMACGVPVIASAVRGLTDAVVDGVTGVHVPPGDPGAIATALTRLLDDPEAQARVRAAGVVRAERYGWDHIADETLGVVGELVGSSTARQRA